MYTRVPSNSAAEEIKQRTRLDIIDKEKKNICTRAEKRNLLHEINYHRLEDDIYLNDIKTQNVYNNVQTNLEQDERLAQELNKVRREEITNLKLRQQLRESCPEIRDLEAKLRTAYATKELAAQIAEKEYFKLKKKVEERENNDILIAAVQTAAEVEKIEAEEEIKKKTEYRKELQDQMIMKYQEKQNKYEEFLKEKKMLDDIIQRIHDEDAREIEYKMCKMKKTKAEVEAFKAAQDIWRQKEKKELEEENKRIQEYLKEREIKEREKELQKMAESSAKEKAMEEMAKKIYAEQIQRKEREEILQDLVEEELKEKEEQKIKEDIQKQIEMRTDMQNVLARQLEERRERLHQEELEDLQYKDQLMAKLMEDEKLEQLSAEKRRRKMLELRREMQEHIKERRAKRAEELKTLLHIQEQDKILENNRKMVIEEERLRLLQEHAKNLIGYLPRGVLREDDLPRLGSEFVNIYSKQ